MDLIIIISLSAVIFIVNLIFLLLKNNFQPNTNSGIINNKKQISVIIAARNEEKNIKTVIDSLLNITYPESDFEVIIVDDNSSDSTYKITKELTKTKTNFSVISAKNKIYPFKRGALQIGINASKYPYIAITDADCILPLNWLESISNSFNEYDFICGISPFIQNRSLVNNVSCFENLKSVLLNVFLHLLGLSFSSTARNIAFTKETFNNIGGFSNTLDTMSGDDDLLIREAKKHKIRIGLNTKKEAFVYTNTKSSFSEYFNQKARHTQTSIHYTFSHKVFLAIWHLFNIISIISPVLYFINPLFLIPFIVKISMDIVIAKTYEDVFRYKFSFPVIIILIYLYEVFIIYNFLSSQIIKPVWKK